MSRKIVSLILVCMLALAFAPQFALAEQSEVRTIRILCAAGRTGAYPEVNLEERAENLVWQLIEQDLFERKLAIDFELIEPDQYGTVLQTRMASGMDADVFSFYESNIEAPETVAVSYGEAGLVLDIKEAVETRDADGSIFAFWDLVNPTAKARLTTTDGKIYWFPYLYSIRMLKDDDTRYDARAAYFNALIRADWLTKIGKEYSLQITTDELSEILHALNAGDANGNGLNDEVINLDITSFNNALATSFGLPTSLVGRVDSRAEDVACAWYCEGIRDYIAYMRGLVADGLYDTSLLSNNNLMAKNQVSLADAYMSWGDVTLNAETGDSNAKYMPLIVKTSEAAPMRLRADSKYGMIGQTFISSNCDDVQAAIDLFDYVYSMDYTEKACLGIEGNQFERINDVVCKELAYVEDQINGLPIMYLGMNALPHMNFSTVYARFSQPACSDDLISVLVDMWTLDDAGQLSVYDGETLCMPTAEETETVDMYQAVLETYSSELLTDLILGQKSLDDLDKYIEEMRGIGLDEYFAVYQARNARYMDLVKAAK